MPNVGNRKHAQFIAENGYDMTDNDEWRYLSGGSMRFVFLHKPTGVVYKMESDSWGERGYGNAHEVNIARQLRKERWHHVRIPKVSLYNINGTKVIAMEYIEGSLGKDIARGDMMEAREEMYSKGRLADMHGENFKFEETTGKLVPIDMASPRVKHGKQDMRVLKCGDGSLWDY